MLTLPFWRARVVSEGDSWGDEAGEDARPHYRLDFGVGVVFCVGEVGDEY